MAVQNDPATHEKPKKPGKRKWTLGLLLLLSILAAVGLWQKNNIEAMVQYNKYSQEELEQQLQSNDAQVDELLQAALEAARQVDAEMETATEAEVKADAEVEIEPEAETPTTSVTAEKTPVVTPSDPPRSEQSNPVSVPETPKAEQTPSTPAEKPQTNPPRAQQPTGEKTPEAGPPVPSGPTYEQQLQAIADKVYALRSQYLKALDDLQAEAIAAYKAMPKEKRTGKDLASFVSTYISKANALEKQCDGKMDALIGELTQLQKEYGQSMELVNQVKYTYANEKSLKKAWYMSELQKRGFI